MCAVLAKSYADGQSQFSYAVFFGVVSGIALKLASSIASSFLALDTVDATGDDLSVEGKLEDETPNGLLDPPKAEHKEWFWIDRDFGAPGSSTTKLRGLQSQTILEED